MKSGLRGTAFAKCPIASYWRLSVWPHPLVLDHAWPLADSVSSVILWAAGAVLGFATVGRNEDYRSELGMWSDPLAKRPDHPRAHHNLGNALDRGGKLSEAMHQFSEALRFNPDDVDAQVNLGAALLARGQLDEAMAHYFAALRINPGHAEARRNLANARPVKGTQSRRWASSRVPCRAASKR